MTLSPYPLALALSAALLSAVAPTNAHEPPAAPTTASGPWMHGHRWKGLW